MVELKNILDALEEFAPCSIKEEWDNVGLMVGSLSSKIKRVIVALDCTNSVINEAVNTGADLIITHHPLIFHGLNSIEYDENSGNNLKTLVKNDINVISMHTNLDKAKGGVNDVLCSKLELVKVQNLTDDELSLGRIGELETPLTLKKFAGYVKEKLNAPYIKYTGCDEKLISKVAVTSGSGSEFYNEAIKKGADVFVTSEVKHNIAIEVMDKDFAVIDAGHFETENVIAEKIKEFLKDKFDIDITVSESYVRVFKGV